MHVKIWRSPFAFAPILHACVTDMGLVIGFRCHSSSFEKAASTYVYFGGKRIACRPTCSGWRSVKLAVTKFRHCFLEISLHFREPLNSSSYFFIITVIKACHVSACFISNRTVSSRRIALVFVTQLPRQDKYQLSSLWQSSWILLFYRAALTPKELGARPSAYHAS